MAVNNLSQFLQKNQNEKSQFKAKNGSSLYYLQNLLTNASLSKLNFSASGLKPTHLS